MEKEERVTMVFNGIKGRSSRYIGFRVKGSHRFYISKNIIFPKGPLDQTVYKA